MPSKTIQVSTRVTQEDADFLAELTIEGARTPSDKLRALIDEARRRRQGSHDYGASLRLVAELVDPALIRLRELEQQQLHHSELIPLVSDWLSETLAFFLAKTPHRDMDGHAAEADARELEAGLSERAFRLVTALMRLGVTEQAPCYDPDIVQSHIGPSLEVAQVILGMRGRKASVHAPIPASERTE